MWIEVGNTYTDVTIEDGTVDIEFPNAVTGSIRPGTIKGLSHYINIKWGLSMTDLIEPGVIPNLSSLMLGENYKHPIDSTPLSQHTSIYIHDSNRRLGPANKEFWLWRKDRPFTKEEFDDPDVELQTGTSSLLHPFGVECTGHASTSSNFRFVSEGPIYIIPVRRLKQPGLVDPASKISNWYLTSGYGSWLGYSS